MLALLSPSCCHDKVVLPFKAGPNHSTPLLVYEAQYLKTLEAVHRKMEASGEKCPEGGKVLSNCNCIAELILSETVAALGQMGVEQKAITK